ncbi:hypothetical protein [Croceicoccus mobilis]|uniref:SMODS and SLOG-associating 2TM effector domain-containing protein n=1 Tax=Croceicoccus mobilis TaxID=1703339 RepID=A0A917DRI6_9SPHN|nr:hypothetical protein [Croceicoccus mobilis]GGD61829.1 hypothetical protein GCM10010990_09120 [Croceicoccus mobilis]
MNREERLDERYRLAFRAEYSSRYHRRRATFLINLDKLLTTLVLICGTGAFLSFMDHGPQWLGRTAALSVTLITIFQVIFSFGLAGARHGEWLRRWERLATDIRATPTPDESTLRAWDELRAGIESECVGELRALAIDCENAARSYLGVSEGHRPIGRLQRLFIHFGTFQQEFEMRQ